MKPLYFILRSILQFGLRLYFKSFTSINAPKKRNDSTIYVSNHPSAFMDPLVIGSLNKASVYFMTMASVFKGKFLMNLFMQFQMLPIFRAVDGKKALENNNWVFKKCIKLLTNQKNLLIFGESITDETFIRRVKPLKKGPFRIGFQTMTDSNWEKDIKIQVIGLNYSLPNLFRSDILMNYGKIFNLKDYKALYLEHPEKAINSLRKDVQMALVNEVVHVNDSNEYDLFENLLKISFKGLNPFSYNPQLTLSERFLFSKKLADKFNNYILNEDQKVLVANKTKRYLDLLKLNNVSDKEVYQYLYGNENNKWKILFELLISFPLFIIGLFFNYIPYIITKNLVEKIFKRPVFWNAVKVLIGGLFGFIFQLPILLILNYFYIDSVLLTIIIGLLLPMSGVFSYQFIRYYHSFKSQTNLHNSNDIKTIIELRKELSIIVDSIIQN